MPVVYGLSPRTSMATASALIAIAIGLSVHSLQQVPTYAEGESIAARPYDWPPGCPPLDYKSRSSIPKDCKRQRRFRLENYADLGLPVERRSQWYRVGDDALLLDCATWGPNCAITDRVAGKFADRQ